MKKKKLLTDKEGTHYQESIDEAGRAMAREIDREILWGMLEGIGWTRVMIPFNNTIHINLWASKHCKGAFEFYNRDFIFEYEQDANWFKLRWLS